MNGKLSNEIASSLAARLAKEKPTVPARIDYGWRLVTGRPPNVKELNLSKAYLDDNDPTAAVEFALSLFNSNAFLYVN